MCSKSAYSKLLCFSLVLIGASISNRCHADIINSSGAGFSFPDNNSAGTTSTIVIGPDETISNVQVDLFGLTHTWVGDLIARISSPLGTTADLFVRVGPGTFGDGSNLNGNYRFADGGADFAATAASIGGGGVIPSGTYQPGTNGDIPISLTSTFAGESTMGTWTLFISDNAQFDTGSLGGWGLDITSTATAIPEPGPLMLVFLSGIMALQRRRQRA